MKLLQKSWARWCLAGAGGAALLLVLAWAALPGVLKSQAERRGSEALGRTVTVGAVDFKPWTLELSASDIRIASADGTFSQVDIARVYLDAELQSILRMAPVLDAITIDAPHIRLTHLGGGRLDIDDVLARLKPDPAAPASAPVRFALFNLVLNGGALDFVDQRPGGDRQHTLRKLDLAVPFLSNLESQREVTVQPRLAFELNGSQFDSAAQATPFAASRKGEATLQIAQLDMAPYLPYLPAGLPLQPKAAVLDTTLKLQFVQATKSSLTISGDLTLSGIRVAPARGPDLLSVESVRAVVTDLRPLEQSITLESLDIQAPQLRVARDASGQLNLGLAGSPAAPAARVAQPGASAPAVAPSAGWQVALGSLNLRGGTVYWSDDAVPGGARWTLGDTGVQVSNIRWPMAQGNTGTGAPLRFEGAASLAGFKPVKEKAGTTPAAAAPLGQTKDKDQAVGQAGAGVRAGAARIGFSGEGTDKLGSATVTVSDLGLKLLAPYVGQFLVPRAEGVLGAQAQAQWSQGAVALVVQRLAVDKFSLMPPADNPTDITERELPKIGLLEVSDAKLDLVARTVAVGKVHLQTAVARVQREESGQWMFSQWLKAPDASPAPTVTAASAIPTATAAPWKVSIAEIGMDDSTLSLVDRLPAKRVFLEMQALKVQATAFSLDGKKPMPLKLSAKIRSVRNDPGSLAFNGSVMWDPLVAQGAVDASQVPVHTIAPYFASSFNLELLRAEANFKGQFGFAQLADGPMLRVQGDAAVDDLIVKSELGVQPGGGTEPATEELLNWKLLSVPGIDLTMVPGTPLRLKVREVALSDFYARLIVNAEGRLVLQDIVKPVSAGSAVPAPGAAPAPAPVPAPAAVTSGVATDTPRTESAARSPFIEIGPISVINGRVAFSDRFIKPNYSADLTELNGKLSQFASQSPEGVVQMADLELRGRAEGTASLEIVGKVNPLAKPLALDVRGKVRDLELSPLSSYAIKYAGYGIERGRLSVDVNYLIRPDGQLSADNKIVLNQLTFGDKVEGGLSSLPVKLAVSLLSDRDGVIDLDLPISGSLSDPQFRIWPVVWKIIGNLIARALTSPFSLFSGGGGSAAESLGAVAFDPGTTTISASALPGLDKVARAMLDKPALQMTIVGASGLEQERDAIKRERLNALVLLEKRRMVAETGGDVAQVKAVLEAEYPAALKEVYRRSDIKKPRNFVGLRKDLPVPEMEALLLASIPVNEDTVRELARRRGVVVREYLTAQKLPSSRLFLGAAKILPSDAVQKPQAELSLSSN